MLSEISTIARQNEVLSAAFNIPRNEAPLKKKTNLKVIPPPPPAATTQVYRSSTRTVPFSLPNIHNS
jgi:hypothetical protein